MKASLGFSAALLFWLSLVFPAALIASTGDPAALWKYRVPYSLDLRPDCSRQMNDLQAGTELGIKRGLFLMHVSDVDQDEGMASTECSRWQTTARIQAKRFDIEKLDLELRRIYADLTLQWRFIHLGRNRRLSIEPGLNVIVRTVSGPRFFGWVTIGFHKRWHIRAEAKYDFSPDEQTVAWNAALTHYF